MARAKTTTRAVSYSTGTAAVISALSKPSPGTGSRRHAMMLPGPPFALALDDSNSSPTWTSTSLLAQSTARARSPRPGAAGTPGERTHAHSPEARSDDIQKEPDG